MEFLLELVRLEFDSNRCLLHAHSEYVGLSVSVACLSTLARHPNEIGYVTSRSADLDSDEISHVLIAQGPALPLHLAASGHWELLLCRARF